MVKSPGPGPGDRGPEENILQQNELLLRQNKILIEILRKCAKLNCVKGPAGKHYKDKVYCGTCTSCQARLAMQTLGEPVWTGKE